LFVPFLAASTECSAGSNDHFVVVVVVVVLVLVHQVALIFSIIIAQSRNLATQQSRNLARNNEE
jgi:hypothetical protein